MNAPCRRRGPCGAGGAAAASLSVAARRCRLGAARTPLEASASLPMGHEPADEVRWSGAAQSCWQLRGGVWRGAADHQGPLSPLLASIPMPIHPGASCEGLPGRREGLLELQARGVGQPSLGAWGPGWSCCWLPGSLSGRGEGAEGLACMQAARQGVAKRNLGHCAGPKSLGQLGLVGCTITTTTTTSGSGQGGHGCPAGPCAAAAALFWLCLESKAVTGLEGTRFKASSHGSSRGPCQQSSHGCDGRPASGGRRRPPLRRQRRLQRCRQHATGGRGLLLLGGMDGCNSTLLSAASPPPPNTLGWLAA